jgi:uncharacterized protein (TIGR02646 family)
MRWICKEEIEECLTEAWREASRNARDSLLLALNKEERKEILRRVSSSNIWRDFYALLPIELKRKCWYCEVEDIRSDMPIDHFRPKNKVDEETDHDGYWWLAFDWENYRCACTFCNSRRNFDETQGGKACRFLLKEPLARVFTPDDHELLVHESPYFLDPLDPDDEKLLWFDNDGKPIPNPGASTSEEEKRKVENSIEIFHLDEQRIVRQRNNIRINVENQIWNIRKGIDVNKSKNALRRMVKNTTELSRAAVVYLRAHRDLSEVKDILELD